MPTALRISANSLLIICIFGFTLRTTSAQPPNASSRERLSFNAGWRFAKGDPPNGEPLLSYQSVKSWLLAANPEFKLSAAPVPRPVGNPGADVSYTQSSFD